MKLVICFLDINDVYVYLFFCASVIVNFVNVVFFKTLAMKMGENVINHDTYELCTVKLSGVVSVGLIALWAFYNIKWLMKNGSFAGLSHRLFIVFHLIFYFCFFVGGIVYIFIFKDLNPDNILTTVYYGFCVNWMSQLIARASKEFKENERMAAEEKKDIEAK